MRDAMPDKKKKPEAGNLAVSFEKPKEKGGAGDVVVSFQDGKTARKMRLGTLGPSISNTDLGPIACWLFKPEAGSVKGIEEIKKKTAGEVKRAVNLYLWESLCAVRFGERDPDSLPDEALTPARAPQVA